ncbi:MAG: Spy/CpxP family protein refolding chaperone [Candidatus Omnitrophica bacterium]|nr:Spy/CpxP family protein refolding chaperone [Candidatus Omnitrophota bacterium]
MKSMKVLMITVLMCSVMALPLVYANDQGGKHEWRGKKIQEIYNQLNLTDDQKKQLESNKQKQRQQMKAVFEQMKTQREAFRQELMKPNLDMAKINSIHAQMKTLQEQMADNRLNSILEVRKILTVDQFSKFTSLMEQHRHKPSSKGEHKASEHEESE